MENYHTLWEIAVLALLREEAMHPYQMQRLLHERHKDDVLVLKRGSLYHAINRLAKAGLIEAVASGREGRRPERTTYRITIEGRKQLTRSLRQMLATPKREAPEFMGALSFLIFVNRDDAARLLEQRAERLEAEMQSIAAGMRMASGHVERINLVESAYLLAMRRAELKWIRGLTDELKSGALDWDLQEIFRQVRKAKTKGARATEEKR
jgi:DNA-binding PadR family transcriptional regulator